MVATLIAPPASISSMTATAYALEPVLTSHAESAESSTLRIVHKNPKWAAAGFLKGESAAQRVHSSGCGSELPKSGLKMMK